MESAIWRGGCDLADGVGVIRAAVGARGRPGEPKVYGGAVNTVPSTEIDWELARRRAARIARPGPRTDRAEAGALVDELRRAARDAPAHVARVTTLEEAAGRAAQAPVLVVDRPRWAQANLQMLESLLADGFPLGDTPNAGRLAAEELGLVLGLLSSRVLGQFDPFTTQTGRLILVAPNVLRIERQLHLDPADFRLWVCLHEQTHAVQFAAAPWLAGHLRSRVRSILAGLEDGDRAEDRLRSLVDALPRVLRGIAGEHDGPDSSGAPLLDVVLDEEERAAVASAIAVMTLVEGHADVVMDAVGTGVIPSLRRIRAKFEARRDSRRPVDLVLRRLLGLDVKVAQYRTGAGFVREVVAAVGHDGLNAVWSAPHALPSPAEIRDPGAWVRRVHG